MDAAEALLDGIAARRHPLLVALEEDPAAPLAELAPFVVPVWTAARGVVQHCFAAGDGSLSVWIPDPEEALPADAMRLTAWGRGGRDEPTAAARLARFVAWPICAAARVRAPDERPAPWRALRDAAGEPSSAIALVVDGAAQAVRVEALIDTPMGARLDALRRRLSRLDPTRCAPCRRDAELLKALCAGWPAGPALPWLQLSPGEALVVPRLVSVGQPERLSGELARWGLRPA